jgi:hypothetical protein
MRANLLPLKSGLLPSVDHVALSLHFVSFGEFNSDYPENPLQEFSQIGYANFG